MRCRNIDIILYTSEDVEYCISVCETSHLSYAYILHDKDTKDDGSLKPPHYHFRVFSDLQKTLSAWSKLFDVAENYVEKLDDKRLSIRYLIHLDNKEKYQYNENCIVTNIEDIDRYFKNNRIEEDIQLKKIFSFIDEQHGYIYFKNIKDYVIKNGYWSSYRRYYSIIKDVVIEHNRYCIDYMLN